MEEKTESQEQYGQDDTVHWALGLLKDAKEAQSEWRQEAEEDYAFFAGDQWSDEDRSILEDQNRPPVVFNRIARIVNGVSGTEIQNRQEVRYLPREAGDVAVNEIQTQAAEWVRDTCDAEDEESESFKDSLITGLGVLSYRMDYDEDPDGMIMIERVDPLEVFWDPSSRKRNLVDRRWCARVKRISCDEFYDTWPDIEVSRGEMEFLDTEDDPHDASPPYYDGKDQGAHQPKDLEVVEFQYYDTERFVRVDVGGRVKEFPYERFEMIQPYLDAQGIKYVIQKRRKYKKLFIQGDTLLEEMPLESQDDFTLQFMTGMRDRNRNSWFGLVRMMIDPQRFANKFFSQIIHIINTSAKSGVYLETGAVDNIRKFEEDFAMAGSISWLNPGAIQGGKMKEKTSANFPAAMDRLLQYSVEAINEIPGVNAELMGMADYTGQSGVLEHQRKQAGITLLAVFFDALRRYRKTSGRVLAEMIREYIPEGTLIRVVGQAGQQYIPLMKDKMSMKYDVIVDDAPTSPNMKERTFAVLTQMLPMIIQAGVKVPPDILDYAPLPESLIQQWKKMLIPDPQQVQEQKQKAAQQEQLMAALSMAEVEKDKADAMLKRAKSFEAAASTNVKQFQAGTEMQDTRKTAAEAEGQQIDNQIKKKIKKEFEIVAPSGEIYVGSVTE